MEKVLHGWEGGGLRRNVEKVLHGWERGGLDGNLLPKRGHIEDCGGRWWWRANTCQLNEVQDGCCMMRIGSENKLDPSSFMLFGCQRPPGNCKVQGLTRKRTRLADVLALMRALDPVKEERLNY